MLYPTINKLTNGKFNRYQLAVATAKCARLITDEYVRERHLAEKAAAGAKETEKAGEAVTVNPDYRDRKAVKIAIDKIESGEYVIVDREGDSVVVGENSSLFAAAHQAGTDIAPAKRDTGAEPIVVTEETLPEEKFSDGPAPDKVDGDYEEEGDWDTMSK